MSVTFLTNEDKEALERKITDQGHGVFFAEYGVTTFEDIKEAIESEKEVIVIRDGGSHRQYYNFVYMSHAEIRFIYIHNDYKLSYATVMPTSGWSYLQVQLEIAANKVSSIDDNNKNNATKYPSIRAIVNYLNNYKIPYISGVEEIADELGTSDVNSALDHAFSKIIQKLDKPSTAEVGQMIVVKAVDEDGKPIEVEAVNVPEVGSGESGADGKDGADGFSPVATVTQTSAGATISIQDKNGITTATIMNGKDGKDGSDGYTPVKGKDYFDGEQGPQGIQGVQGEQGPKGDKGDTGEQGPKGDKGDKGDDGKDGTGVTILGSYDSVESLKNAHPVGSAGDSYLVSGYLYVWSETENDWNNVGQIQGPKGDKGDTGATGSQGPKGDKGDKGDTGATGSQGIQGIQGEKGADGYTPQKGIDYFDGQNGKDGQNGLDGYSPTVNVTKSGKVTTITIADKNGTHTATINDGTDGSNGSNGQNGKDGTSVTVAKVSESTADGGNNVVTFSDGKTLTVKNGSKGSQGEQGPKGDTGSTGEQGPKGDKGDAGATGQRGTGLLSVTTAPSSYTTEVGGITPKYRMELSTIKTQAGVTEVLLGDTVRYSYYQYPIAYLDTSYAYFTTRISVRGTTGTSVTVESVSESTADGGSNVVTFSDGKTLTVKNGSKGSQGEQGLRGETGYTPQKGVDYWTEEDKAEVQTYIDNEFADINAQGVQQTPLFANSIEECTDTTKVYVLPDGYIYGYVLTKTEVETGGYTNKLPLATETYNGTTVYGDPKGYVTGVRLSSSGSTTTNDGTGMLATGFIPASDNARIRTVGFVSTAAPMSCYVISYNASGSKLKHYTWSPNDGYISDFTLDSATYGTGIAYIRISSETVSGKLPSIVTVNEEIKESSTTIVEKYAWANTGRAFVPADYEERIIELEKEVEELEGELAELESGSKIQNLLGISEVFAPSPQLPADGSEGSDFNGDWDYITAEQIYAYIDALLNKYPRFITKEVMGKDESGTHDWCRYTCSRRAYDAWQKPNYPPMYAWVSGSTVIYSVSVSPRIGDTLYTTAYIGTSKGTVTAVSNANQTRTVGGVVYTRDKTKDVEPTLVYTETTYSPYFSSNYANYKNGVYDNTKVKISTVSSMNNGTLTGVNGVTYTRYPLGDRNSKFKEIPSIVIGANEHGTGGDPATPAMITARIIKDLCECKNADNPFLNLLKNDYMMVFCPVVNPWGLHKNNKSYHNSNDVNLDRNFDTIGWGNDTSSGPQGEYGGSENETQYFMNTLVASKCKLAMCNHSYGHGIDNATGEAVSAGICSYMLGGDKPKYNDSLLKIAEVMAANYNLVFNQNSNIATPDTNAKTRSYFEAIGIDGVALEINSREGFITDPNNEAQGKQFTARVMEAGYTQLLQVLYMMIAKQD